MFFGASQFRVHAHRDFQAARTRFQRSRRCRSKARRRLRTRTEGSTAGAVVPYERKAIARLEGQSGVVHGLDGHDIAVVRLDASADTTENVVAKRPAAGIVDRD